MLQKGTLLRTQTKTLNDMFGEVLWEVVETGLDAHDEERPGAMDGVRCVMLGGTGPSVRVGYEVYDSESQIERDIASGITTIISSETEVKLLMEYSKRKDGQPRCGNGIELEA
jgi:hypothetical protein